MTNNRLHITVSPDRFHDHMDSFPPDRCQNLKKMISIRNSRNTYMPTGRFRSLRKGIAIEHKSPTVTTCRQRSTIRCNKRQIAEVNSSIWTWRQILTSLRLIRVLPEIIKTVRIIWKCNLLIEGSFFGRSWIKLKRMVSLRRLSLSPQDYHLPLMFLWGFRIKKSPSRFQPNQCLASLNLCPTPGTQPSYAF